MCFTADKASATGVEIERFWKKIKERLGQRKTTVSLFSYELV